MWEAEAQTTAPLALLDERGELPSSLSLSVLDYYERLSPEIPQFRVITREYYSQPLQTDIPKIHFLRFFTNFAKFA